MNRPGASRPRPLSIKSRRLFLAQRHFPHQLSRLIDNPLRRLLISPSRLANRLPIRETSAILEIGPGSGYFSVELARRVPRGRLSLLDLQPEMLNKAQRKLLSNGFEDVDFTAHDASLPLPFEDDTFDVVVLVAVLGEISDANTCLREIFRVTKPGGVIGVHEHVPDPDRIRFSDLRSMFETTGFLFADRRGPLWNYTAIFERPSMFTVPS